MKRISVLLVVLFSFPAFDYPQERTISGKITSRDDGGDLPEFNPARVQAYRLIG